MHADRRERASLLAAVCARISTLLQLLPEDQRIATTPKQQLQQPSDCTAAEVPLKMGGDDNATASPCVLVRATFHCMHLCMLNARLAPGH